MEEAAVAKVEAAVEVEVGEAEEGESLEAGGEKVSAASKETGGEETGGEETGGEETGAAKEAGTRLEEAGGPRREEDADDNPAAKARFQNSRDTRRDHRSRRNVPPTTNRSKDNFRRSIYAETRNSCSSRRRTRH